MEGRAVNVQVVQLPTALVRNETHQCRQGLEVSSDVQ